MPDPILPNAPSYRKVELRKEARDPQRPRESDTLPILLQTPGLPGDQQRRVPCFAPCPPFAVATEVARSPSFMEG